MPYARGLILTRDHPSGPIVAKWPKPAGRAKTPGHWYHQQEFGIVARWAANPDRLQYETAVNLARGTEQVPRDILQMAMMGTYYTFQFRDGTTSRPYRMVAANAQFTLDQVTNNPGAMLYRAPIGWVEVPVGTDGHVLALVDGVPTWTDLGTLMASSPPATSTGDGTGTPTWSAVALLLGFEGADGATTATDESGSAHTLSFNRFAHLTTTAPLAGNASLALDGSLTTYVSAGKSPDWTLPGKFTMELLMQPATTAYGMSGLLSAWTNSTGGCSFRLSYFYSSATSKYLKLDWSPTGSSTTFTTIQSTATNIDQSVRHHVAVDRDASDTVRLYLDGAMVASATVSGGIDPATALLIGAAQSNGANSFNGLIDEVRVTKGEALYQSDTGFTGQVFPFPRS